MRCFLFRSITTNIFPWTFPFPERIPKLTTLYLKKSNQIYLVLTSGLCKC